MLLKGKGIYLVVLLFILSSLACSLSAARQQAQSAAETASSVKTQVGGVVNAGSSLIDTAQALATEHSGILETAQTLATKGSPVISTIQAVATNSPGLVATAQAFIAEQLPTGEPPTDIPILAQDQVFNYFGSSQYIFYTTPTQYPEVLSFYQTQMESNGWELDQTDSHEYANAAELVYLKGTRTATLNLSLNPLSNTSVIAISISNH
jgi:hypothetical protein